MVDIVGSIRLVKDASDTFNMGTTNCGSVYLKATRIQETWAKSSEKIPEIKTSSRQSTGPNTWFFDPLMVNRSWNITGIFTGSPDAYVDINRIGSMIRFGKLSMLIIDYNVGAGGIGSYMVDFLNFQTIRRIPDTDTFDYTLQLLAGSMKVQ